ncbi:MAG: long-chain fatty acid--CoA ligase [Gammaproteobacteria bacterium]
MAWTRDYINPDTAGTLHGLFRARVERTPDAVGYRHFDNATGAWSDITWSAMAAGVARWQTALQNEALQPGDRVAIMLRNCPQWVLFDQAALSLGLVVVPLFTLDRAENAAYILQHSGAKLLLIEGGEHWSQLYRVRHELGQVQRILTLEEMEGEPHDPRLRWVGEWLPGEPCQLAPDRAAPGDLASIVYTSGTTGRPKGVMLSHHNMVWNSWASVQSMTIYREDLFLSFLPLSHTLERTAGYYIPMLGGATVAYARSIAELREDLVHVRPTVLISVPRIFERVHGRIQEQLAAKPPLARRLFEQAVELGWRRFLHQQGKIGWQPGFIVQPLLDRLVGKKVRARLGGRLRLAVCGGAALPTPIARLFIGLGLTMVQGYGLTESSPVISVNRQEHNDPASVGEPLPGVEVKVADNEELLVRGPNVMLGYWKDPKATGAAIDAEGWLHTGDRVRIEDHHIYITGRLKEIIVLSNGEKVSPVDMESAIVVDRLFDHVLVTGEGRPYLVALVVLNPEVWAAVAGQHGVSRRPEAVPPVRREQIVGARVAQLTRQFPGYAKIHRITVCPEPWTVDNGLLTPTMKLRRAQILRKYAAAIDALYNGH